MNKVPPDADEEKLEEEDLSLEEDEELEEELLKLEW